MHERPLRIHVVDTDATAREGLVRYLQGQGMTALGLPRAEDLLAGLQGQRPDIAVVDVHLPDISGIELCRRLRGGGDPLPLILVGAPGNEADTVIGLESGADDHVGRRSTPRELLARIRAVLRRGDPARWPTACSEERIGAWRFIPGARCLDDGQRVRALNTIEFALLAELVAKAGVPVSRERLLAVSHRHPEQVTARAVDAAVMRLRRLVEPEPARPRHIRTIRGQGYMFVPADRMPAGTGTLAAI